jgi:hypothetical protein
MSGDDIFDKERIVAQKDWSFFLPKNEPRGGWTFYSASIRRGDDPEINLGIFKGIEIKPSSDRPPAQNIFVNYTSYPPQLTHEQAPDFLNGDLIVQHILEQGQVLVLRGIGSFSREPRPDGRYYELRSPAAAAAEAEAPASASASAPKKGGRSKKRKHRKSRKQKTSKRKRKSKSKR